MKSFRSFVGSLIGDCTTIISGRDEDFCWSNRGYGVRYLLVAYSQGELTIESYDTSANSRAALVAALESIKPNAAVKLLGVTTREVTSDVYDLDVGYAIRRLQQPEA